MRNILLLLSIALFGIAGCNATTGASYPTGYNTPAAGTAPSSFKDSTVANTCAAAGPDCIAVYSSGSAGKGVAAGNAALTNTIRVYSTDGTNYTVVRKGLGSCGPVAYDGTFSVTGPDGNGLYTVTLSGGSIGCPSGVSGTIIAQPY